LDLFALTTVSQGLGLQYLSALTSLDLSSLTSVGSMMQIASCPALTTLALPALTSVSTVSGWAQFSYNATLASISAPLWTTFGTGTIEFYDNPGLPTCQAQALADQISAQLRFIELDDDSAICP
jgi:hypothetical protein